MSFSTIKEFREIDGKLAPFVEIDGKLVQVAWAPLPGSQDAFLRCRERIVLFQGARGATGKSETLHADFLQFVGVGLGADHAGIIVKKFYPELEDLKRIGRKLIPKIHPNASFNETNSTWTFSGGETLSYRPFPDMTESDRFLGRNISWCGFDELANYRTLECFLFMLSILRSGNPKVELHLRATTNTWGPGADEILEFFQLTRATSPMIGPLIPADDKGPARRVITGDLAENLPLLYVQPDYQQNIASAAGGAHTEKAKAWLRAIWVAPPTNFFSAVDFDFVRVPSFEVPAPGRIRLGFDHGLAAPSAAVFVWESKGEDIQWPDGRCTPTVKGDLYVVEELYTAKRPNVGDGSMPAEIAERLHAICERHGWNPRILSAPGNVADTSIFSPSANDYRASTALDLERAGVVFGPADKARVLGAGQMLKMLLAAKPPESGMREQPGLFICENCTNLMRALPNMQRDPNEPDDVSSDGDDHLYDALRFFLRRDRQPTARIGRIDKIFPRRPQQPPRLIF